MSPPGSPSRAGREIGAGRISPHACEVSLRKRRGVGALAVASGSDRHAWRVTERGRLPGRRALSAPAPRVIGPPWFRRRGRSSRPLVAMSSSAKRL